MPLQVQRLPDGNEKVRLRFKNRIRSGLPIQFLLLISFRAFPASAGNACLRKTSHLKLNRKYRRMGYETPIPHKFPCESQAN